MYQTKNLGLNITEIDKDSVQPFSFETDLGANFKAIDEKTLSHRNITNCLLEVPQNIKLELSNGTLTLKEGSKVYIPNGFEADGTTPKFDEFIINNDVSLSDTSGLANGKQGLFYIDTESAIHYYDLSIVFSGSTAPTSSTYSVWYDTTNNKILETRDSGVTWENQGCLPLCIFTSNGTNIASIDQVFNGFGYMGSIIWLSKGVKIQIPYGRNEDGSLNNIKYTLDRVLTTSSVGTYNRYLIFENSNITGAVNCYEQAERPPIGIEFERWFDTKNNLSYYHGAGGTVWQLGSFCVLGKFSTNNGTVTTFLPKTPFRAVDYNDYHTKITELEAKIEALQAAVEALQGS